MNIKWIRDTWLPALRSGRYTQGKGRLRQNVDGIDQFCCLGVACDLTNFGDWSLEEIEMTDTTTDTGYIYAGSSIYLPSKAVKNFLDLESGYRKPLDVHTLAERNDSGDSFDEIADYIEAVCDEFEPKPFSQTEIGELASQLEDFESND
jgi:hypothetical protein